MITSKVASALAITHFFYHPYSEWLKNRKINARYALKCRTIAVVEFDRYMTGRR